MAKAGILSGVAETKIAGIPLGAAATGALVAGAADAVIGFLPASIPGWAIKGIGAFATLKWGANILGTVPAQTAALFLTYDAVQEFFDLRGLVSGLFSGIALGAPAAAAGANGNGAEAQPQTIDQWLKKN